MKMEELRTNQCSRCLKSVGDMPGTWRLCAGCRQECIDDDEGDNDDGPSEYGHCEACHKEIMPYQNDHAECSACHMPGCYSCLRRGDDVFPYLCWDCP